MPAQNQQGRPSNTSRSPSWFCGAPITKLLFIISVISYLIGRGSFATQHSIGLDCKRIFTHWEIHRLFFYTLCFDSTAEMLVGLGTLYNLMTKFEREMGPRKFLYFLLKSVALATFIQIILAEFLFDLPTASIGPYPQLGVMLYLFYHFSPRLYPKFFGILGFDFSEKSITYIFSLQMIVSTQLSSFLPSICGFISSYALSSSLLSNDDIFPESLVKLCERLGTFLGLTEFPSTLIHMASSSSSGNRPRRSQDASAVNIGRSEAPLPPPPAIQPSPAAIEALTAMGFDRDNAIRALVATNNNIEAAANVLLTG